MKGFFIGEVENVFIIGIVFLIIGAVLGYGAKWILRWFGKDKTIKFLLILKLLGFVLTIAGFLMVMYGEFPQRLQFIRII